MPANGIWDLIRRLKVNKDITFCSGKYMFPFTLMKKRRFANT